MVNVFNATELDSSENEQFYVTSTWPQFLKS